MPIVITFLRIPLLFGLLLLAGPAFGACADSPAPGVEVSNLQTLDLFSGGRRDAGLPADLWKGSSAGVARDLIPQLGTKPLSPAAKALAGRLLATAASAPDGAGADQAAVELMALSQPKLYRFECLTCGMAFKTKKVDNLLPTHTALC